MAQSRAFKTTSPLRNTFNLNTLYSAYVGAWAMCDRNRDLQVLHASQEPLLGPLRLKRLIPCDGIRFLHGTSGGAAMHARPMQRALPQRRGGYRRTRESRPRRHHCPLHTTYRPCLGPLALAARHRPATNHASRLGPGFRVNTVSPCPPPGPPARRRGRCVPVRANR